MKIVTKSIEITNTSSTYFIADIAANHDGKLERALRLIELAAEAGANAAKFQHFRARTIVSNKGFSDLGKGMAHQVKWEKSVVEVYREAELPVEWTEKLKEKCNECGIDFFSAIYDLDVLDEIAGSMPFFKIGSGDITWAPMIEKISEFGKPVFIATGASTLAEVEAAMNLLMRKNLDICLMQCNTNYTNDQHNPSYANLKVLSQYKTLFPNTILGLSDHTSTPTTTLGAVALGATVVEKHFTDDRTRKGPDHAFSLDFKLWSEMVLAVRELESSLGDGQKKVEDNELESQVVQRRSARVNKKIKKGEEIYPQDIVYLRPCPTGAATPFEVFRKESIVAKEDLEEEAHIPSSWL